MIFVRISTKLDENYFVQLFWTAKKAEQTTDEIDF